MKYLQKFLKDRRGVTPVVGVILMVAITVVMGAVVAGFVYGYVGTTQKGPLLGLSVTDDPSSANSFLIKHTGGESVVAGDWKLSVTANEGSSTVFDFASNLDGGTVITEDPADIYAGRTLVVTNETVDGNPAIDVSWYHVVITHAPSNSLLLDTNVFVR